MGNSQVMPKVDFKQENLKSAYTYSKILETKNIERAILARGSITRKRVVLSGTIALVLGIYGFTIYKIKQETFLEDFDEPETIRPK